MTDRRRILVVLESRATYGYSKNVMLAMRDYPELELITLVTGMHLIDDLGSSIDLIHGDGIPVSAEVPLAPSDDGRGAWARAVGGAIPGIVDAIEQHEPDIMLLSGDRVESFACAVTGTYVGLPMAHIQAGDKSGHIDDIARMAMAKLCHIHFASCEDSAERLRRLGEEEFRIHNVGAPQLDDIVNHDFAADRIEIDGYIRDLSGPYILLVQHPVMAERDDADGQMRGTVRALAEIGLPTIWIYPNSDLGFRKILDVIADHESDADFTVVRNVERRDFLTLLANAAALVGNSSSGILEAPSLKVPVVNIGTRQRGRLQAANILDCGYDPVEIAETVRTALGDAEFQRRAEGAINPYGDGRSGQRICEVLRDVPLNSRLLDKKTTY